MHPTPHSTESPQHFRLLVQVVAKVDPDKALKLVTGLTPDLAVLMLLWAAEQLLQGANIQINRRLIALLSRMITAIFDGADPTPSAASPATATDDNGSGGGDEALGRGQRTKRARVLEPAASPAAPSQGSGGAKRVAGKGRPSYWKILPIRRKGGRPQSQCIYCSHDRDTVKGSCPRASPTTRCKT